MVLDRIPVVSKADAASAQYGRTDASGLRLALAPGQHFKAYGNDTVSKHTQLLCRRSAEVYNPGFEAWPTIIDADEDGLTTGRHNDSHPGTEGIIAMCSGEFGFIVALATGGLTSVKFVMVIGSDSLCFLQRIHLGVIADIVPVRRLLR